MGGTSIPHSTDSVDRRRSTVNGGRPTWRGVPGVPVIFPHESIDIARWSKIHIENATPWVDWIKNIKTMAFRWRCSLGTTRSTSGVPSQASYEGIVTLPPHSRGAMAVAMAKEHSTQHLDGSTVKNGGWIEKGLWSGWQTTIGFHFEQFKVVSWDSNGIIIRLIDAWSDDWNLPFLVSSNVAG